MYRNHLFNRIYIIPWCAYIHTYSGYKYMWSFEHPQALTYISLIVAHPFRFNCVPYIPECPGRQALLHPHPPFEMNVVNHQYHDDHYDREHDWPKQILKEVKQAIEVTFLTARSWVRITVITHEEIGNVRSAIIHWFQKVSYVKQKKWDRRFNRRLWIPRL